MWYFVDGVLILKEIVWPTLTLIDVAKPRIEESSVAIGPPQSDVGSPGRLFSHATGLTTGGPHGPTANACAGKKSQRSATAATATAMSRRREASPGPVVRRGWGVVAPIRTERNV